ncbi:hypothetical protein ACH4UT_27825 [Streptomyces sp. NPDC020799]
MIRRLFYFAIVAVLLGLAAGTCSGQDTSPATPPPATKTQLP